MMHLVLTFVLAALFPILAKAVEEPALITISAFGNAACENVDLADEYACTSLPSDDMTCAYPNLTYFMPADATYTIYSVLIDQLYDDGPCDLYLFSEADESGVEGYVPSADLAVGDCFYFTDGYPIAGYAVECLDPSFDS